MPPDPSRKLARPRHSALRHSKSRLSPTFLVGTSTSKLIDSTAHWSGKRICFWCDKLPVVTIINFKRFKSSQIMDLVRSITILTLVHNFTFTAKHIPGLENSIADSLSRFQMDHFHSLAPNASSTPCTIPPSAMAI